MTRSLQELDRNFDEPKIEDDVTWHDARSLLVEGQAWPAESQPFTRMPDRAHGVVREDVWILSRSASGICVRFSTDSPAISARYTLRFPDLAMNHMPAVGVSGLDLYVRDGQRWKWAGVARPSTFPVVETLITQGLAKEERDFLLYLPLYNGVESLHIGIATGSRISAPANYAVGKPILFYGTSVTQGGCAARPGMVYTSILGRHLNRTTINLGFSGNGRAEPEVATLLAELDPAIFVLDCVPNIPTAEVTPNVSNLVDTLRRAHSSTPLVLVENLRYQNEHLVLSNRENIDAKNRDVHAIFDARRPSDPNLHLVPSHDLWGDDTEATIDGIHATDVGFLRMAEKMEPLLRSLL